MLSDVASIGVIAWSLLVAGLIYLPFVAYEVLNDSWRAPGVTEVSQDAILSVVALGVLCSAIAFVALFALIAGSWTDTNYRYYLHQSSSSNHSWRHSCVKRTDYYRNHDWFPISSNWFGDGY
jgi:hypothetical protein